MTKISMESYPKFCKQLSQLHEFTFIFLLCRSAIFLKNYHKGEMCQALATTLNRLKLVLSSVPLVFGYSYLKCYAFLVSFADSSE